MPDNEITQPESVTLDMTDEDNRRYFHLLQLKGAIRLEGMGMRHSSGRSALAFAKKLYGFTGNRDKVLVQIQTELDRLFEKKAGR